MSGGTGLTPLYQINDEDNQDVVVKKKKPAVSLSAKSFKINPPMEEPTTPELTATPENDVTETEATLRGVASGLSFDLADDLIAAFQSLGSAETFQEKLKKQQKREEMSGEKFPVQYYGGIAGGGAASLFIPGVGPIANTARIANAAKALKLAKSAQNAAGIAVARRVLTKELVKGGAASGAISGLGASEKESLLDTIADTASGAVTGGAIEMAVPKAAELVSEGAKKLGRTVLEKPELKPIAEGIGEGVEKAKGAIEKVWKGDRWQVPEFAGVPKKQREVDEIVKQGKQLNLTDRQILNNIAVTFPELSKDTLENIFQQKGVAGVFKRAIAGSQEAAEFIDRPEQLEYAEEAAKGQTGAMAKQTKAIETTKDIFAQKSDIKSQLMRESQDLTQQLSDKRRTLQQQWDTADTAKKQQINQEIAKLDKAEKQLNVAMQQRKNMLDQYERSDKDMIQTVKTEMEKAAKTRSDESLNKIAQIEQEIDERVKTLGRQKVELVESLMDIPATESEMKAAFDIQRNMQNIFRGEGLGKQGRQALNDAYGGDLRFEKVKKYFDIKESQRQFDVNQENIEWNKKHGLWDETKLEPKPGGRPARAVKPEARPEMKSEDLPTVGELVGALYAANSKISSAAHGNPLATVKREVGKAIQEGMKDINAESYAIQRYLNSSKANLETLRASPLFESRKIPVVGPTGRIATPTVRMIKTEIPEDFASSAKKYRGIISQITRGESMEAADVARSMKSAKEGLPVKPNPRIGQLQREIGNIESRIAALGDERQRILDEQFVQAPGIKLARSEEKRTAIGETVKSKLGLRNRLRQIDDEVAELNKQLVSQGRRKTQIGETEAQLIRTLRETEGVPTSARDVAQFGTIAAKGEIPWISGKLLPSAKDKIKMLNRIKNQFANPSLNSAVRVAIERPITIETIRSLSQTHNVPEDQLTAALTGQEQPVKPEKIDIFQKKIESITNPQIKEKFKNEYNRIINRPQSEYALKILQEEIDKALATQTE